MTSPVIQTITPVTHDLGAFKVRRAIPAPGNRLMVGPFIFVDQFGPAHLPPGNAMDVRPHPHINLATVTWLFEGSMAPTAGDVMTDIGARESVDAVAPMSPAMSVAGCTPMSANRLMVACCRLRSSRTLSQVCSIRSQGVSGFCSSLPSASSRSAIAASAALRRSTRFLASSVRVLLVDSPESPSCFSLAAWRLAIIASTSRYRAGT